MAAVLFTNFIHCERTNFIRCTEGRNAGEENISICMFQENHRNPTVRCFPEPELQTAISIKFPRTGINKCQMCLFICLGFDPFPIEGNFIIQRKEKREVYCSEQNGRFSIPAASKQHRGILNFAIGILLMLYSYLPTLSMVKVHFKECTCRYSFLSPAFSFV